VEGRKRSRAKSMEEKGENKDRGDREKGKGIRKRKEWVLL